MNAVAEASHMLRDLSLPWGVGGTLKAAINKVTKAVNEAGIKRNILEAPIKPNRIEDIWRREARYVRAEEMDAIRAAKAAKLLEEARAEFRTTTEWLDRIDGWEHAGMLQDPNFFREMAAALRAATGRPPRPLDSE